jgi:phage anti-repressor protein
MHNPAAAFVKQLSAVPESFVDELFAFYNKDTLQTDFVIDLAVVAKWLKCSNKELRHTLRTSYKQNIDYIIEKNTGTFKYAASHRVYKLTPDCFKRVCMLSRSKNAEMVRTYYIEIESLFLKYRQQTEEGMQAEIDRLRKNQKPSAHDTEGYIYVIRAATGEHDSLYKIGRTGNLKERLSTYNTGSADNIEVLYKYRTDQIKSTEGCIKSWLKDRQYRKYKEVYSTDIDTIKMVISRCGAIGAKLIEKNKSRREINGGHYVVFLSEDSVRN